MTGVLSEVGELNEQVGFLFEEQVIQDQRIFALEQDTDELEEDVEGIGSDIQGVRADMGLFFFRRSALSAVLLCIACENSQQNAEQKWALHFCIAEKSTELSAFR